MQRPDLRQHGIMSDRDVLRLDDSALAKQAHLTTAEAKALVDDVTQRCAPLPVSGQDLLAQFSEGLTVLSTGCQSIDDMLAGGLYSGELTELVSASGSGKTQLCFSCAAKTACQLYEVVYFDSGSSSCGQRIADFVRAFVAQDQSQQREEDVLRRIQFEQTHTAQELLDRLHALGEQLVAQPQSALRLLVVDSLAALLTPLVGGRQTHGPAIMSSLGVKIKALALDHNLAVLVTNYMVSEGGGGSRPALGVSWASVPHMRLQLHTEESDLLIARSAVVLKSQRLQRWTSCRFLISEEGLTEHG
eukprot:m.175606 g.175606  ORF g.175606 m.175606 type:complete len:303 (-) comp21360_c0_seq6:39-947(-)